MKLETLIHSILPAQRSGGDLEAQKERPTQSIIWLHGLGADNKNFLDLIPYLGIQSPNLTKIIFPQAPDKHVTANGHMRMPAWYDIRGWDFEANMVNADFAGMQASVSQIHELINEERAQGVLAENIMIGGFSQGGVIGLLSSLTYPEGLAGAFGLSCYLPNLDFFQITQPLKTTEIFMAHGQYDTVVPYFVGKSAKKQLSFNWGANVEWHSYAIEHTINLEESKALGHWINTQYDKK